jgi:hypothetical protein
VTYFDPAQVEDVTFEALPNGWYRIMLDTAEGKATKAGNGRYINCKFHVVEGPFADRILFHLFNVINPNEMAQKIGHQELKKLLVAIGRSQPAATEEELLGLLADGICYGKVTQQKDTDGKVRNKIKEFAAQLPEGADAPSSGVDHIPF